MSFTEYKMDYKNLKTKGYMKPHYFSQKSLKRQDLKRQTGYKNYKKKAILPTVKRSLEQNVN